MRRRTPLLLLVALAGFPACDDRAPDTAGTGPLVVVTIHPVASLTAALAGDAVAVRTLLPPGAHPDTYQITPRDARTLAGADLLIRVGGAADAWVGTPSDMPVVTLTDGTGNPHVWLDPIRVRDAFLPRIEDALVVLVPDSAPAIRRRAAAWADSLSALDAWVRTTLDAAPDRRFVAAHPAWPYFADRYGLEQVGVVHESPGHEPGSRALATLVAQARERGVRAVIAEPQLGAAGVAAMAGELRARVGVADPVGGPGLDGREDYPSLMRYNARVFARALGAPEGTP